MRGALRAVLRTGHLRFAPILGAIYGRPFEVKPV